MPSNINSYDNVDDLTTETRKAKINDDNEVRNRRGKGEIRGHNTGVIQVMPQDYFIIIRN